MGSTKFEGGLLQSVYKWNKLNYPQLKDYNYLQKNQRYTMVTQDTNRYKDTRKSKWDQHMSQACPNSTYSIGLLFNGNHKSTQDSRRWCLPKWDTQPLLESHHKSNEARYNNV